jgi:hypothetical protein
MEPCSARMNPLRLTSNVLDNFAERNILDLDKAIMLQVVEYEYHSKILIEQKLGYLEETRKIMSSRLDSEIEVFMFL